MAMEIDRRMALTLGTSAFAGSLWLRRASAAPGVDQPPVRFGLVTDLHHADKPTAGTRHYRDTMGKLNEAIEAFTGLATAPRFVVELGDFIDAADSVETERKYLAAIDAKFRTICAERYYVLGNHCVDTLTSEEFLADVGQKASFYAFDHAGRRFVVLNSCFRKDGVPYGRRNFEWSESFVPDHELAFLEKTLKETTNETIVFVHQRLDVAPPYGVINAERVRAILEKSGRVRAVFQGHSHKNDHQRIAGIDYVTLVAMVEGAAPERNGYALVDWHADGSIELRGFREQKSYGWPARS